MNKLNIAVLGAGAIGQTHLKTIAQSAEASLAAIIEPSPMGAEYAEQYNAPHFQNVDALFNTKKKLDGAIIATPNETHRDLALQFLQAGIPVLIEKPIAHSLADAEDIIQAQKQSGLPILVGHHRRYNPIIRRAKEEIDAGALGELVIATVMCSLMKPDEYFKPAWRREPGTGGPVLINAIHEIDLLRHFFGEISAVSAMKSNHHRGYEVEDSAALVLRFLSGGLASLVLSDAATGPWAWDLSSGENVRFAKSDGQSHHFAGTQGALSLPGLFFWSHKGERSWSSPLLREALSHACDEAYHSQLQHFCAVLRGEGNPLVSAEEGHRNLKALDAMIKAAEQGVEISLH